MADRFIEISEGARLRRYLRTGDIFDFAQIHWVFPYLKPRKSFCTTFVICCREPFICISHTNDPSIVGLQSSVGVSHRRLQARNWSYKCEWNFLRWSQQNTARDIHYVCLCAVRYMSVCAGSSGICTRPLSVCSDCRSCHRHHSEITGHVRSVGEIQFNFVFTSWICVHTSHNC